MVQVKLGLSFHHFKLFLIFALLISSLQSLWKVIGALTHDHLKRHAGVYDTQIMILLQ